MKLTLLLINDDPTVLTLWERLAKAHCPEVHSLDITSWGHGKRILSSSIPTGLDLVIFDPGSVDESHLKILSNRRPHSEWLVCYSVGFLAVEPYLRDLQEIHPGNLIRSARWADSGIMSRTLRDWFKPFAPDAQQKIFPFVRS